MVFYETSSANFHLKIFTIGIQRTKSQVIILLTNNWRTKKSRELGSHSPVVTIDSVKQNDYYGAEVRFVTSVIFSTVQISSEKHIFSRRIVSAEILSSLICFSPPSKLLIFSHLAHYYTFALLCREWIMSQITHLYGVKFLTWKSGKKKFQWYHFCYGVGYKVFEKHLASILGCRGELK